MPFLPQTDPFSKCKRILSKFLLNTDNDDTIELKWNGVLLKDDDSPETYFFGSEETISVGFRLPDGIPEPGPGDTEEEEKISVKVQKEGMKHPVVLIISPNETVEELLKRFCENIGESPDNYSLQFDGETMKGSKTLIDYEIEDDFLIDAIKKL